MNPDRNHFYSDDVLKADGVIKRFKEGADDISFAQAIEAERVVIRAAVEFNRDKIIEAIEALVAFKKEHPKYFQGAEAINPEEMLKETEERFKAQLDIVEEK